MDDHEEAMVAFSQGLATDPKESAMLTALVETMLKSSLRGILVCICVFVCVVCVACVCVHVHVYVCMHNIRQNLLCMAIFVNICMYTAAFRYNFT